MAVAQHAYPVADLKQLLQTVADIEHTHVALAQQANDAEQLLNFRIRKRAGGFVKHDDLRVLRKRLGNLHHLLRAYAKVFNQRFGIHPNADFLKQLVRPLFLRSHVYERALAQLVPQKDVRCDGKLWHKVQFLIDHADAKHLADMRGVFLNLFALKIQFSRRCRVRARKNLHQRRLAGAVFAHKNMHLARVEVYVDVLQSLHTGKILAHMLKFQ